MKKQAVAWYTYVLSRDYMKFQGDPASARRTYMQQLKSESWITFKMKQLTGGNVPHWSWELFHHWVKLSALGATDSEINSLISCLKAEGLVIGPDVDANKWRSYFTWYQPNELNHKDVDSKARGSELASVCTGSYYGPAILCDGCAFPGRVEHTYTSEEHSLKFLSEGEPGGMYRNT